MKFKNVTFAIFITLLLSSCASIVSSNKYPLTINSTPSEASFTVTNRKGLEVVNGKTPSVITLKSKSSFFKKEQYEIAISKNGYDAKIVAVTCSLDGWYWGNAFIGGLIGMLIVDPITGAMYKLDASYLSESLTKSAVSSMGGELQLFDINNIPTKWNDHLVLLTK